jgi:hypothetical protein
MSPFLQTDRGTYQYTDKTIHKTWDTFNNNINAVTCTVNSQGFQNKPAEFRLLLELLPPATFRLVTGKILYTGVQTNQYDVCYVPIGIQVGLEIP